MIFGRFQSGSLSYNDQGGTPSLPRVWQVIPVKLGDNVWKYGPADNLRFRATGPTRLTVNATFIDLSVAGRGSAVLSAANFDQTIAGSFSVDASSFCGERLKGRMRLTPARFSISSPVAG